MKIHTYRFKNIEIQLVQIKSGFDVLNVDNVTRWCTEQEFQQSKEIISEKRKREFFALRYLLYTKGLKGFLYYENQVPKLENGMHISVSHSHDWLGVAFCEEHHVGMDLELVQNKVARVYEKFIHDAERELFPNFDLLQVTLLWSFKETIFKLMRQPGLLFSQNICVSKSFDGTYLGHVSAEEGKFEVSLAHHFFGDYVLTFNSSNVQKKA